jgi:molecular chaperone IbpA
MGYNSFPDVYRALSVGFEDTVKQLDSIARNTAKSFGYPPYNIVKVDENKYVIEVAVAGFSKQDLTVELKENSLVVSGNITANTPAENYLYKGIADRAFTRAFNIADTVEIQNTQLMNGMLKIFLENIIPEHKKSRKFDIEDVQDTTKTKK